MPITILFLKKKKETQEKQEKKDLVFAMQIYNVEHQNYQFTCMCINVPIALNKHKN